MADERTRTARGDAHGALLGAAAERVRTATLAHLLGFLHVRELAGDVGVSLGTVSYHMRGGQAPFAGEVARHLLDPATMPITDQTLAELDRVAGLMRRKSDEAAVRALRQVAVDDLSRYTTTGGPRRVMINLASAAAPHDDDAAAAVRAYFDVLTARYAAGIDQLLDAWGRTPVRGVTSEGIAVVVTALADGFALRRGFDPERATPELFGECVLSLTAGLTRPAVPTPDEEPVRVRLLRQPDRRAPLDPQKRAAIVTAANDLYREGEWPAVTVPAVAARASVDARTVKANFGGDRDGLAAAIWMNFVPELRQRLRRDKARPLADRIHRHFVRVLEIVALHRDLSQAMFATVFVQSIERGLPDYTDPTDVRTHVPLPMLLAEAMVEQSDQLRAGVARTDDEIVELANFLTHSVLNRALARREARPADTVDYVMDICLPGIVKRRGR